MDSIKNAIVTVTLLVVGYGSYVVLKQPASGQFVDPQTLTATSAEDSDLNIAVEVGASGLNAAPTPTPNGLAPRLQSVTVAQSNDTPSRFAPQVDSSLPNIGMPKLSAPNSDTPELSLPKLNVTNLDASNMASTIDNAAQNAADVVSNQFEKSKAFARETLESIKLDLPPLPSLMSPTAQNELPKLTSQLTSGIKDALIEAEANPSETLANIASQATQAAEKLKAEVVEPLKARVDPPVARLVEPRPAVPPPFAGQSQQLNPFDRPLAVDTNEPMPQLPNVSNWEEYEGPQIDAASLDANNPLQAAAGSRFEPSRFDTNTLEAVPPSNGAFSNAATSPAVAMTNQLANAQPANAPPADASTLALPNDSFASVAPLNQNSQSIAPPSSRSTTPGGSLAFERVWGEVQQHLKAKDYTKALRMLTPWSSDSNLGEEQSRRCVALLDQLAGTIIYSRDSYLQEPHTVQAGETLDEIAAKYSVPQDLLAKINGVSPPYALNTGEKLKVISGPFRATVSILNKELTLYAGAYYAGRFSVDIGRDLPPESAFYEVAEKSPGRTYFDRRLGREVIRNEDDNRYGDYWMGLRGEHITTGHQVGIHGRPNATVTNDIGSISMSPNDAEDVFSILSVGSRIEVRP